MESGYQVTLVTATDCHLCERARKVLTALSEETPITVREVAWDAEEGRALVKVAGVPFPPAVYVNGKIAGYGRVSERALRRRLAELIL